MINPQPAEFEIRGLNFDTVIGKFSSKAGPKMVSWKKTVLWMVFVSSKQFTLLRVILK